MIEKVSFLDTSVNCIDYNGHVHNVAEGGIINKLNELVDAVNELQLSIKPILEERESGIKVYEEVISNMKPTDPYKSITFMSDGHITKFYGYDSIVELELPLPQGTKITIKETKGE